MIWMKKKNTFYFFEEKSKANFVFFIAYPLQEAIMTWFVRKQVNLYALILIWVGVYFSQCNEDM